MGNILGIDPSINSTGLCVWNPETKTNKYYVITSHMTKKMKDFQHDRFEYLPYEKDTVDKSAEYQEKERAKTENILDICERILYVIGKEDITKCYMEGISYGSTGSAALADLAGLNFAIRCFVYQRDIPIIIYSPNSIKSFATGIGNATKETVIDTWKHCDPEFKSVKDIKVDDVADAYFIAHLGD